MYVRVDLDARTVALAEPDNFKQFHVVSSGDGLDDDVADLLGDGGRRCDTPSHVWVGIDLVRRLAEPQVTAEWADGFEKMLGFANKMGWIDPSGAFVKAHTEWPVCDGRSLWDLIDARVALTPSLEMACDERGERITFAQFAERAERMAAGLYEMGIRAGDVVSWELPSWIDAMVLSAAIHRLDAVQNPIIAIYREREVAFCTKQAGAKLLVVPGVWRGYDYTAMANSVAAANDGLEVLSVARGAFPDGDPGTLPPRSTPSDEAPLPVRWLFYTSGTTSDPKGARHTDTANMIVARTTAQRFDVRHGDRPSLVFPFPHIGGIMWMVLALQYGATLLFEESFDATRTPQYLSREGCTHPGSGTPFHVAYLEAQRAQPGVPLFPRAKCFPGGGAPKPPQLTYDVAKELGAVVVSGWGLTEVPILTMASTKDTPERLAETEGFLMPGVELIVVKSDGTRAAPGEEGELRAKAPQMMVGYLDARLDADAFDEDGYFRTGDLGTLDADGYVVITGRLKDVIIRNAENISAKEVEDLLYTHPKVRDVAVVGLPDPKTGERVCAVVACADAAEPLSFVEMTDFLAAAGLRRQALPEQLELVDAIPRNPAGKITKNVLRDRYDNQTSPRK
jgi:acyl-CoA synthetase (AMP-forming)/AMP-acid ligase II